MARRTAAALIALLVALLAGAAPASADVFNVTTTDDGQGQCTVLVCTLRAALEATDQNGNNEPDTINVPQGDYELSAGPLMTGTTNIGVTIAGAGADVTTIRGNGKDRLLYVGGESEITLQDITFAGGTPQDVEDGGGNILAFAAAVTLNRVRLTGGIANQGAGVSVSNGLLVIRNSLIDGNRVSDAGSGDGGGVLTSFGTTLEVTDSTITGNTARNGGGLASNSNANSTTTLTRVTLAGNTATNSASGALASFNGSQPPKLSGTIVARNLGQRTRLGPLVPANCTPDLPVDDGGNLEDANDCGFTHPSSRPGVADPGLETTLRLDGGRTPVLPISATSPARDLAGACTGIDQRGVTRPNGAACDAGAYEFVPPVVQPQPTPTPSPPPPSATPTPAPTPVPGRLVVAEPRGTILVRIPPSKRFVRLAAGQAIPLGSTVDAKRGRVVITASANDKATFFSGIFRISQSRGLTTLTLTEQLAACRKSRARAAASKPKKRRLWGDGKGKFRTKGRYSAATVRGTKWLVEDTCAGTLTRVTQGSVTVTHGKKRVIVRKGKRYLARPKR